MTVPTTLLNLQAVVVSKTGSVELPVIQGSGATSPATVAKSGSVFTPQTAISVVALSALLSGSAQIPLHSIITKLSANVSVISIVEVGTIYRPDIDIEFTSLEHGIGLSSVEIGSVHGSMTSVEDVDRSEKSGWGTFENVDQIDKTNASVEFEKGFTKLGLGSFKKID